ncbi:MAG TPA: uroporphyrinogen decarboxylase family protein, partial [Gemmiger qucibialis]|nr:uroporphyrinogen decarboxylase family protein [Gemmiger qucibialis]
LDAAILFSDILTIPDAMGLELYFVDGEGPKFRHPVRTAADVEKFGVPDMETELRYVMDAVRLIRRELDGLGLPYTLVDLTTPENQQRDGLLALFEALTDAMDGDACYYADATFGTKTYPLVLSSALHYAEKILDDTEVCGIYYRELTRENGKVKSVRQYDISTLFTLDGIVDMAAEADLPDKQKFISVMLHPDREV